MAWLRIQLIDNSRLAICWFVCLLLASCGEPGVDDTGTASLRIAVPAVQQSAASGARLAGRPAGVPAEVTRIDITITDTRQHEVAAGDLVANGGVLELQVNAGEALTINGTALASSEILFAGSTQIAALQPNERRSIGLRLHEMVSVSLTPPAEVVAAGAPVQIQAVVSGLNNTALRWYVNGVAGGSSSFGFIDDNGLYTPPATVPADPVIIIRSEPVAAPSFAVETVVTLAGPANTAPVAAPASFTVNDGEVLSAVLSASDADGDPLVYSLVGNATAGTVVITDSATGAFTYTPNSGVIAEDSFQFRVNDGVQDSAAATVSVSVGRIINIDARVNGTPSLFPSVNTTLQAGSYVIALVSPADEPQALFQGWSYGSGNAGTWVSAWSATRSLGADTLSGGNWVDSNGSGWNSAAEAFAGANNRATGVVVTATETFGFYIGDNQLSDNRDGVSLRISVATATADLDADGLDDLQEVTLGTRPGNPDSDADGVNDGAEVNITSTDPLDPDTDYDGLQDGAETNTGTFVSDTVTGTDPNTADSDGDQRFDGAEVFFGSDPLDSASTDLNLPTTTRVNTASGAFESNQTGGWLGRISATGRYVVFHSEAGNLVRGDDNGVADIFWKDTDTWQIKLVSRGIGGAAANGYSHHPAISADGRYVAFYSEASNLVPGDTNNAGDIFRADIFSGEIVRVNTDVNGNQSQGAEGSVTIDYGHIVDISADGSRIVFASRANDLIAGVGNGFVQFYVKDMNSGVVTLVSSDSAGNPGNADSVGPGTPPGYALDISFNGTLVAFVSSASNLVANDSNGYQDAFIKDLTTGATIRVSTSTGGGQLSNHSFSPHLSADGRYVAFGSQANNVIAGDVNGAGNGCGFDVYVKDLQTDITTIVSTDSAGNQPTALCNTGNMPRLSADGRYVAFMSANSALVPDDNNLSATNPPTTADNGRDIFIKDRNTGQIVLVSRDANGNSANSGNWRPALSSDGRYAVYYSLADNLVPDDNNGEGDMFRSVNPLTAYDPAADDDSDGLSNETELTSSFTLYFVADTDGDGIDDGAEISNGTDPNDATDPVITYTVTATATSGGSISPASATVVRGNSTSFTVAADAGYSLAGVSGCGGTLTGNTYTTGEITADCTVSASFTGVLNLSFQPIKTFRFSWLDIPGTSYYRLLENPDGVSGFTPVGADIPQGTQMVDHIVPLYARINAQYILQSCDSNNVCSNYATTSVSGTMDSAIGYFKAGVPTGNDNFGYTVAISGDGNTLAVGAFLEDSTAVGINGDESDNSGNGDGAVYVFVRDAAGTWSRQAYIKASVQQRGGNFGKSVDLSDDGNTLVVGAITSYPVYFSSGTAHVFTRTGTTWSEQAILQASNPQSQDEFGTTVTISGDGNTVAVFASGEDSGASGTFGVAGEVSDAAQVAAAGADNSVSASGAVYLFTRSGTAWSQQAYIKAGYPGTSDYFGQSLALNGNGSVLAVGAYWEKSNATGTYGIAGEVTDAAQVAAAQANNAYGTGGAGGAGAAYVFALNGGIWRQTVYIKASSTSNSDEFGWSLDLSADGNTLAVGARKKGYQSSGAVFVFTYDTVSATWSEQAIITPSNTPRGTWFGDSVALSADGNLLAVGHPGEYKGAAGVGSEENSRLITGAVFTFTRSGGTWTQQTFVKAPNPDYDDRVGHTIDLSANGDTLAVGAYLEDSGANGIGGDQSDNSRSNSGAAYLY